MATCDGAHGAVRVALGERGLGAVKGVGRGLDVDPVGDDAASPSSSTTRRSFERSGARPPSRPSGQSASIDLAAADRAQAVEREDTRAGAVPGVRAARPRRGAPSDRDREPTAELHPA